MKIKLLGFGSIFCSAYVILAIITIMVMPLFVDMEGEIPVPLRPVVGVGLTFLCLAVIGIWFFIIFDIIHVSRNPTFSEGAKAGWICAIWLLNVFAIPIYWLKHLRQDHQNKPIECDLGLSREGQTFGHKRK